MDREDYDCLFKYIIIGNTSCGKTCVLHHFLEGKFKKNASYTIGVEFGSKLLQIGKTNIKLQIWDTAGQERFKSVARTYYRGALGAIIVYDTTSFLSLSQWIKDARELARPDISIVVCGNKCDLKENRVVQQMEAQKFCQENNVNFLETSALQGENINEAFMIITKSILDLIEQGVIDQQELKPRLLYNNNGKLLKPKEDERKQQKQCGCISLF